MLSTAELVAARESIAGSPLLGANQLGGRFARSEGYSIVAHADALPAGPLFAPPIAEGGDVYYFNALVLGDGAHVGPHVDTSLSPWLGERVFPRRVAVLYLDVPERGGDLVLYDGGRKAYAIAPRPNLLVTFAGELVHAVERVRGRAPRTSWVCEAYVLGDRAAKVPRYAIATKAY